LRPKRRTLVAGLCVVGIIAGIAGTWLFRAMASIDLHSVQAVSELGRRLRSHVEFLASDRLQGRRPGTPGHQLAAAYIADRFHEVGLAPLPSLQGYGQPLSRHLGPNLIGARPASTDGGSARWILIAAHYDHLGESRGKIYLGADDNSSAVAILLELARRMPPLRRYGLLFVSFDAEEPPFIRTGEMGSQQFVARLPAELGTTKNIQAVIVMDLMGGAHWPPLKDTIFAAGAEKSPGLYETVKTTNAKFKIENAKLAAAALSTAAPPLSTQHPALSTLSVLPIGMHLIEELPVIGHTPVSDYDAFRNAGVPHLFLSAGRTPRYHQPTDRPDTLHYERMAATVDWLAALLHAMDADERYTFEEDRLEVEDEVNSFRPLLAQASHWDTRIPGTSPLSLMRLKQDASWLERLEVEAALRDDRDGTLRKMEMISIRMQCLLADFYGCALF
jgi:hypothetical protein